MTDMPNDPQSTPPQGPPPGPPAGSTPPPPAGATPPPPAQGAYAPQPAPPMQGAMGAPGAASSKDDTTMALLVHVSAIFTGFVGPLIIWLIKKDESPFVDAHGKSALNFQFTLLIAWVATFILIFLIIGLLLIPVLLVVGLVFPILAAMKANAGEYYTYPLAINFLK